MKHKNYLYIYIYWVHTRFLNLSYSFNSFRTILKSFRKMFIEMALFISLIKLLDGTYLPIHNCYQY